VRPRIPRLLHFVTPQDLHSSVENQPSSVPPTFATSEPAYLDITFGRTTRIWWALVWRALLLGAGAGFVIGFMEGFSGALLALHWLGQPITTVTSGFIVGLPIGIYALRVALRKQYRDFAIRLVACPR